MNCENIFCIYQRDGECIIGGPYSINIYGICESYITYDIPADLLRELKEKTLDSIEARYND